MLVRDKSNKATTMATERNYDAETKQSAESKTGTEPAVRMPSAYVVLLVA